MKRLFVTEYHYRDGLDGEDLAELTKKFAEVGDTPGTVGHYTRLDGQGGFVVREDTGEDDRVFEIVMRYAPWVEFESHPVGMIEETFPIIQSVYG